MILSTALLNTWDPQARYRDGDERITCLQIITLPLVCISLLFTFPIDLIIVPFQLRRWREE
jgi:hypothetical protein